MSDRMAEAGRTIAREEVTQVHGSTWVSGFFSSLRVRLLALVALALLPALALILYDAWSERQDASDEVREDVVSLTKLSVVQQQQVLEGSRQLLVTLSPLASTSDLSTLDQETCGPLLSSLLGELTFYSNMGIATSDGNVGCSAAGDGSAQNIADRRSFVAALETGEFAVGRHQVDSVTGRNVLDLATPIVGQDGDIHGALFLDLDLDWLSGQLAEADLPGQASLTILDDTGTVVARFPEADEYVGVIFPEAEVVSAVLSADEGTEELRGEDGSTNLYGFTRITQPVDTGLYSVVSIPKSTAFASVNEDLTRDLTTIGIVALVVVAAAWVGSELFVVRKTKRLVLAANRLSSGDLGARSGIDDSSGEIGTLAGAFDTMAEALEARISQQERAEADLRQLAESLEQRVQERTTDLSRSNSDLEDFTYVVSHDLKEPLRGIEAFSSFIADDYGDRLDDEGRRYIAIIRDSSVRMKNLIEDMLELSKVGRQELRYEAVNAGTIVEDVLEDLRFAITEKGVEVVKPDSFPLIVCDRVRIREVFKNLISNAIKFNNGDDKRVELSWDQEGDHVVFRVKDNGIGIAPEFHDKVFQIFQRLERREDYPGTGAGLTICRKIVESHGGEIGVISARGHGSTFWFRMPVGLDRQDEEAGGESGD